VLPLLCSRQQVAIPEVDSPVELVKKFARSTIHDGATVEAAERSTVFVAQGVSVTCEASRGGTKWWLTSESGRLLALCHDARWVSGGPGEAQQRRRPAAVFVVKVRGGRGPCGVFATPVTGCVNEWLEAQVARVCGDNRDLVACVGRRLLRASSCVCGVCSACVCNASAGGERMR
jgi:hypothetical protein